MHTAPVTKWEQTGTPGAPTTHLSLHKKGKTVPGVLMLWLWQRGQVLS